MDTPHCERPDCQGKVHYNVNTDQMICAGCGRTFEPPPRPIQPRPRLRGMEEIHRDYQRDMQRLSWAWMALVAAAVGLFVFAEEFKRIHGTQPTSGQEQQDR